MSGRASDAETRFTDRARFYDLGRPGYPDALTEHYRQALGVAPETDVADVGAGTGIHTALLDGMGARVFAVEPNPEMRAVAERRFSGSRRVEVRDGSDRDTGLPASSVAGVFAAQAFHWFDPDGFAREVRRIVRPGGFAALVWNVRNPDGNAFTAEYEGFLHRRGTGYAEIRARWGRADDLMRFFAGRPDRASFPNPQPVGRDALMGMVKSSSFMPGPEDVGFDVAMAELEGLFEAHAQGGRVTFVYATVVYSGRMTEGT